MQLYKNVSRTSRVPSQMVRVCILQTRTHTRTASKLKLAMLPVLGQFFGDHHPDNWTWPVPAVWDGLKCSGNGGYDTKTKKCTCDEDFTGFSRDWSLLDHCVIIANKARGQHFSALPSLCCREIFFSSRIWLSFCFYCNDQFTRIRQLVAVSLLQALIAASTRKRCTHIQGVRASRHARSVPKGMHNIYENMTVMHFH